MSKTDLTLPPYYQTIADQLLDAPCTQQPDGTWLCRFGPDGRGPSFTEAKLDSFRKACALVEADILRRAAQRQP